MSYKQTDMKYKAVLFDLDGTLLDTARDIMQACNYTLEKFGFSKLDESILRTKITAGMREMMKLSVPKDKWDSAGVETVMRDCFANYYTEHINDRTVPFDGRHICKSVYCMSHFIGVFSILCRGNGKNKKKSCKCVFYSFSHSSRSRGRFVLLYECSY